MAKSTIEDRLIKSYWWAIPLHYVVEAIVLCWLWDWYAPHVISGAQHIGLTAALGIVLMVELFKQLRNTPAPADALTRAKEGLRLDIGKMLLILLVGYLIHAFFV